MSFKTNDPQHYEQPKILFSTKGNVPLNAPEITAPEQVEPAADPTQSSMTDSLTSLNTEAEDVSGNVKLTQGDLQEIEAILRAADLAEGKGIPNTIDRGRLEAAAKSGLADASTLTAYTTGSREKRAIEGEALQESPGSAVGAVGVGIASASLFAQGIFDESLAALKTGDFANLQKHMDEIKGSANSVMAHLNFLESSPDGTTLKNFAGLKKEPIVADVATAQLGSFASPITANMPVIDKGMAIV